MSVCNRRRYSLVLLSAFVLGATSGNVISAAGGVNVLGGVVAPHGFDTKPDANSKINQNEIKNGDISGGDYNESHTGADCTNEGKRDNKKIDTREDENVKGKEGNLVYTQGGNKGKSNSSKGMLNGSTFGNLAVAGGAATLVGSAAAASKKVFDYVNKKENSQISEKEDENNNNQKTMDIKPDDKESANNLKQWIKRNPVLVFMLVFLFLVIISFIVYYFVRRESEDKDLDEKLQEFIKECVGNEAIYGFRNYREILKRIKQGETGKVLTLSIFKDNNLQGATFVFLEFAETLYDSTEGFWYVTNKDGDKVCDSDNIGDKTKELKLKFMPINDFLTFHRNILEKVCKSDFCDQEFIKNRDISNNLLSFGYMYLLKKCPFAEDGKEGLIATKLSMSDFYDYICGFTSMAFDKRSVDNKRLEFTKYLTKILIEDNEQKYKLSDENKIFLKNMYNALVIYGQLVEHALKSGFKDREGQIKKHEDRNGVINDFNFYLWVLDWCISNIKNRNNVSNDDRENNEKILFLAKVVAADAVTLSSKKNGEVQNKLGTILGIYEGKDAENNNDNLQDFSNIVDFKNIQFMN